MTSSRLELRAHDVDRTLRLGAARVLRVDDPVKAVGHCRHEKLEAGCPARLNGSSERADAAGASATRRTDDSLTGKADMAFPSFAPTER